MIVKICGIRKKETLLICEKKEVDFFGMIFYKKSPRNINLNEAYELQKLSKKMNIKGVGVFVDEEISYIKKIIKDLELMYVQLHGDEDDDYIKSLKKLDTKIIKKISISKKNDLKKIVKFSNADFFLFDYKPKKKELPGGNAKKFDWQIIKDIKINKPWFLSGGINISNIKSVKLVIKPYGIDLSSGVEKITGIKDNHTINNLMDSFNNA
tara:strand:- start:3218 stop:3847 length:630 start_codon:yes stop_codon:yes gene_type:complete